MKAHHLWESHCQGRWWKWRRSRMTQDQGRIDPLEKSPQSIFQLSSFGLTVLSDLTGKSKHCSSLNSDIQLHQQENENVWFPLLLSISDSMDFWVEKKLQGHHPVKCLIRSLKFLCHISPSGPSVSACTPKNGTSSPFWAAHSIFTQPWKLKCFNSQWVKLFLSCFFPWL